MSGFIGPELVEQIRQANDIVELIQSYIPLKRTGGTWKALCPFHNEKTPSFSVNQDRQFYYCFGCGAGGNAIGFVMNFEQSEFPQALETLARDAGLEVPREESKAQQRKSSENAEIIEVLELASKFYQFQLRQHSDKDEAMELLDLVGRELMRYRSWGHRGRVLGKESEKEFQDEVSNCT